LRVLVANKEAELEAKADRTKCVFMSRERNAGKYRKINAANKFSESVANFEYFVTTLTS